MGGKSVNDYKVHKKQNKTNKHIHKPERLRLADGCAIRRDRSHSARNRLECVTMGKEIKWVGKWGSNCVAPILLSAHCWVCSLSLCTVAQHSGLMGTQTQIDF